MHLANYYYKYMQFCSNKPSLWATIIPPLNFISMVILVTKMCPQLNRNLTASAWRQRAQPSIVCTAIRKYNWIIRFEKGLSMTWQFSLNTEPHLRVLSKTKKMKFSFDRKQNRVTPRICLIARRKRDCYCKPGGSTKSLSFISEINETMSKSTESFV